MVILQFNKVIRNKWLWGAIAVLFCLMFAGEDIVNKFSRSGREGPSDSAGTLGGENVPLKEFEAYAQDVRLGSPNKSRAEQNKEAWKYYAAAKVAERAGVAVTDSMLSDAIQAQFGYGGFDYQRYAALLQYRLGVTPEVFESRMRRQMAVGTGINGALLGSSVWASPMETDLAVADETDSFTVSVARFTQSKESADAVKVDDEGLRAWYDKNQKKIALPERFKIRYVRYDATNEAVMAAMSVSEDEMHDQYDAQVDKYTTKDTNGVEVVKKFEEVKDEIERDLRKLAALNYYETNLLRRAYTAVPEAEKGKSRLDAIAAEDGREVGVSDWFATAGAFVEGFMVKVSDVLPGVKGLADAVSELDPSVEDLRYAVVMSDDSVWLVEKAETSKEHTPTFEEAKDKIGGMALKDAKADAFKAEVESVIAKGAEAVLAQKDVTTNFTFVANELKRNSIRNQDAVVKAAKKLKKGEISEFTPTGTGRAVVVVCIDRKPGDAAAAVVASAGSRDQVEGLQYSDIASKWADWNLERLGFAPTDAAGVAEDEGDEEPSGEGAAPAAEKAE